MDFSRFKNCRLLVAGEVGIDEYLNGEVTRISPEAPVPVVEVTERSERLGLAANVAQNLSSLGAQVTLLSLCGKDEDGERIQDLIESAGITQSVLIEDESRPTLRKVRVLAGKQHIVRVDFEKTHGVSDQVGRRFKQTLVDLLPECDGVIIQDYGKGLLNPEIMSFVANARELGKPVYVDPSRLSPLKLYRGTTLLSPNVAEAVMLCGLSRHERRIHGSDDEGLWRMAQQILTKTEAEHVVITCGPHGMVSATRGDSDLKRIPTYAKEVFDVTGAGDTVIAVLALTQVLGQSLAESMRMANAAAGIVVGRVGTASVTPDELQEALDQLGGNRLMVGQRT